MNNYLMSDEEDPKLKDSLTPGTSEQAAPVPFTPAPMAPIAPQAKPLVSNPAPAPVPQNVPRRTLPGMPSSVSPADLEQYLGKQKASIQKFGPDQQMELEKNLINERNGLGYKTTDALKGFSDALMQGVAEAGNPENQARFEQQQNELGKEQLGTMQKAHEQQGTDIQKQMAIDSEDPNTPISQSMQKAYSSTLMQAGVPQSAIQKMPASVIGDLLSKKISLVDALARIQEEATFHRAEIGQREQQTKQSALEGAGKMGWWDRNFGQPEVYKSLLNAGGAKEDDTSSGENFDAVHAKIPKGQTYKGPDGKMRIKQ